MRIRDIKELVEIGNLAGAEQGLPCLQISDFQPLTTGQLQPNVPASSESILALFSTGDYPVIVTRIDIQTFYTDAGPTQTWPYTGLDQRGYGSLWFEVNDKAIQPDSMSWFLLANTDLFLIFQKGVTVALNVNRQYAFGAQPAGVPSSVNFCTRITAYSWRRPDNRFTNLVTQFLFSPVDPSGVPLL